MTNQEQNNCDGCQRGLPIKDGIHKGKGYDMIGCTAERYQEKKSDTGFNLEAMANGSQPFVGKGKTDKKIKAEKVCLCILKPCTHDNMTPSPSTQGIREKWLDSFLDEEMMEEFLKIKPSALIRFKELVFRKIAKAREEGRIAERKEYGDAKEKGRREERERIIKIAEQMIEMKKTVRESIWSNEIQEDINVLNDFIQLAQKEQQ